MVLQHAVAIPHPVEHDQQVLPHDPEQDDVLAVLLGPPDQAEVGQQANDRGYRCGGYIFPIRCVRIIGMSSKGFSEKHEQAQSNPTHGGEHEDAPEEDTVDLEAREVTHPHDVDHNDEMKFTEPEGRSVLPSFPPNIHDSFTFV